MESVTSEEGARPKTLPVQGDRIDFETFLTDVKDVLLNDEIQMLATALDFKPAERDRVERSEDPSYMFVQLLKRKGIISKIDISALTEKLKFCGLHGVADDVNDSFKRYQSKAKPQPRETHEYKERKLQFVTELKNKYKNLCGEIQPAPFLRDKYDINELFVESGIKFLGGRGRRRQQNWIELKNYKKIFTDPRMKSKRRLIQGEPGHGKSTLALQITHDWCHEMSPMNDFEILILLRLRQFRNVSKIYGAIKKFLLPRDSTLTEDDIKTILDGSSTVILLDGYDEYPGRGNRDTDIEYIIRGDMFQKHDVVLTTRTSCVPPLYSVDTRLIKLTGFDDAARHAYIRKVVAHGCSDDVDKINQFLKSSQVPADLLRIPLFLAMICYLVHNSEKFQNLRTVTDIFRYTIKCFHSHREITVTKGNREKKLDHSKLDKVAFEGISGDMQQISWGKNKLRGNMGKDLYDEYVRIGILIEEESFDFDNVEYNTVTRFFHKLFAEWYAAHYLAKVAAQPEAEFEPWSRWLQIPRTGVTDTSQKKQAISSEKIHRLKNLNPDNVHYVYRHACALDPKAALKIIKHLGTNRSYDKYTLLCIKEWGGSLDTIDDTVTLLCSREINIKHTDSFLLQKSTVELIEFASNKKIPIARVLLDDCLDVGSTGNLRVKPSNLSLPVMSTHSELAIFEYAREITEEETDSIFQYSAMCQGLQQLGFHDCLLPRYMKVTESMSVLRSRIVGVFWGPGGSFRYTLNLETGQWEHSYRSGGVMTDQDYQRAVNRFYRNSEWLRQHLKKDFAK